MKEAHFYEQEELLEEGEQEVFAVRKHWIVYVENFFLHLFGCVAFLWLAFFLETRGTWNAMIGQESLYGAMILIMFVLIFWTSFFYAWTKDYFDVWHVTDRHIIAVNQKELFNRDEMFLELQKIQDVQFQKEGFLATFLGYGMLQIQSAGTEQEFVITNVRDVEDAAHSIMELRDEKQGKTQRIVDSVS